jgi:predicted permease
MDETAFSIPKLLYEEGSFGVFLLCTVILGGGAGWLTGRAIAGTWRPIWQVIIYALILGLAVRFIHFSLFGGTLLSPHYYLVDSLVCMVLGLLGFRVARVAQMVRQYRWINETDGRMRWRRRTP